jgi:hypothetical protein
MNPVTIIAGIAIVLVIILIIFIIFTIAAREEEKNRVLMEQKFMPEIASKFGKAISVSADALRFERNETIFDAKISPVNTSVGKSKISETEFEVRFDLPNLQEKFFIRHKSVFSKHSSDCQPVLLSEMPEDFIFHSLNPQFLSSLLEKEKIRAEIYKYPSDWFNRFGIAFENGVFIITWRVAGGKREAEKLEQICQTAVIFYNELSEK